ncbi:uncharacterized protein [Misgurnus anguillicaudatus]|uniref:uncharacterized protein isoform X2 n=1 Tax=Misgurnus anguillicaudatus TaxID=75329 RepID=UPI003CCF54BD
MADSLGEEGQILRSIGVRAVVNAHALWRAVRVKNTMKRARMLSEVSFHSYFGQPHEAVVCVSEKHPCRATDASDLHLHVIRKTDTAEMASVDIAMDIQHHDTDSQPLVKHYRASEPLPGVVPVLHSFLQKGPASWAAVQASSGILSFCIGAVFAASFNIGQFLLTLFRVPILTGILFMFTGILSNLLYKHPDLLQTCFCANIGCLFFSAIGVILLSVDLTNSQNPIQFKMEVLVLCVTLMDLIIASLLIFFIYKEKKRNHKH